MSVTHHADLLPIRDELLNTFEDLVPDIYDALQGKEKRRGIKKSAKALGLVQSALLLVNRLITLEHRRLSDDYSSAEDALIIAQEGALSALKSVSQQIQDLA